MPRWDVGEEPVSGYKLVDFLGRGGFGEVWLAEAPGGIQCALKIIDLISPDSAKELKALRLMKRLRHPHLVPITAFWIRDRRGGVLSLDDLDLSKPGGGQLSELLICMGLGEKSLSKRLEEVNPLGTPAGSRRGLPAEELLRYMEGAAKGIDYLNQPDHRLGEGDAPIIHCDIKPGNLLVVADEAQVCDYGLARAISPDVRRVSMAGGTPAYSPPELLGNKPCPGTDQYSLAITYHELRTGCLPFPEDLSLADIYRIHAEDRLDFTHDTLTPRERDVLRRATRSRPADRFQNCRKFIDELKAAVFRAPTGVISMGSLSREALFSPPPVPKPLDPAEMKPGTPVAPPQVVRPTHITPRAIVTPRGSLLDELREGGKPVPGYTLAHLVATDTTGQTWQATDKNDRLRVLRVILQPTARDHLGVAGLETLQRIEHDHVGRLYEFCFVTNQCEPIPPEMIGRGGPPPGGLILATEDVVSTLADRLAVCQKDEGRLGLPEEELIRYLREASLALEVLSSAQPPVLHLRLRPDVFGLTRHGSIKLLDAGTAPFVPAAEMKAAATYAAPEVLDQQPSARSDPYALSLVYYKLRTGRMPFVESLDLPRQKDLKKRGGFEWALVTPAERDVLARATSPNPGERFGSARALVDALAEAFQPSPVPTAVRNEVAYATPRAYEPASGPLGLPPSGIVEAPRPSERVPASYRETPKPSEIYETPRRTTPQFPEPQPPDEIDSDGTLTPGFRQSGVKPPPPPAEPVAPWTKSGTVSAAQTSGTRAPRPFLPPPVQPRPKPKVGLIVAAVAVGLMAVGGILYITVFKPGPTPSTTPSAGTSPPTGTPPTTPSTGGTKPTDNPHAAAESRIAESIRNGNYSAAHQAIGAEPGADDAWRKAWDDKLTDDLKNWLAVPRPPAEEARRLIEYRKTKLIDPDVDTRIQAVLARIHKLPAVPATLADLLAAKAAARAAALPYKELDEKAYVAFESSLEPYETNGRASLFRADATAFRAESEKDRPDAAALEKIAARLEEIDPKQTHAIQLFRDLIAVQKLLAAAGVATAAVPPVLLARIEAAWLDPELKPFADTIDRTVTRLIIANPAARTAVAKWDSIPTRANVEIRKSATSQAELEMKTGLTDLGKAMLAAAPGKVPLDAPVKASLTGLVENVRKARDKVSSDSPLKTDPRPEFAGTWIDCRSSAGKAPQSGALFAGLKRVPADVPEFSAAAVWEACRQLQLDPAAGVADVRAAKAALTGVAKPTLDRIADEFQAALGIRIWDQLKRDNPDYSAVAALCPDKDDHGLGWKDLAAAEQELTRTDGKAKVGPLVEAAKGRKSHGDVVPRPRSAEFDELAAYLKWAAAPAGSADDAVKAADAAVKLVRQSDVWTPTRKARAAGTLRSAVRMEKPREQKGTPFLGPVYDPTKARTLKAWLEKADEWAGPDPSITAVQALVYDAAGEAKTDAGRKAARDARGTTLSGPQKVRLGILKAEAEKSAKNDAAAAKAAGDVAWDVIEWMQAEVNKKFKKDERKGEFDTFDRRIRTDLGPAFDLVGKPVNNPVAAEAAAADARLKVVGFTLIEPITPADRLTQQRAVGQLTDAIAAAPARADEFKAWRATARFNLLTNPESDEWLKRDEAKTLWKDMWADASDAAAKGNAQGKLVRGLARYFSFLMPKFRPLGQGEANWPTTTTPLDAPPEFLAAMWSDLSAACDALKDRNDARLWYARGFVGFEAGNPGQLNVSVDQRARYLGDAAAAYEAARQAGFQPASLAAQGAGQALEDWGWLAATDAAQATDRLERAVKSFRDALSPFDGQADAKPAYVRDLGRCEYLAAVFSKSRTVTLARAIDTLNGVAKTANPAVASDAAYWLGRAYSAAGRPGDAEDAYAKVADTSDKASLRDLYLGLQLLSKAAKTPTDADRRALLAKATAGGKGDPATAAFLKGRAKRIEKVPGVAEAYQPVIDLLTGPDRVKALANPAVMFALGDTIEAGGPTARIADLLESLERFAWQVTPQDRAGLLLIAANALPRSNGAGWDRLAKLVVRDAGFVPASSPAADAWKKFVAGDLATKAPAEAATRISAAWAGR